MDFGLTFGCGQDIDRTLVDAKQMELTPDVTEDGEDQTVAGRVGVALVLVMEKMELQRRQAEIVHAVSQGLPPTPTPRSNRQ